MTSLPINSIPAGLLNRLGTDHAVLLCNEDLGDRVLCAVDFDPASLREIDGFESLSELRRREDVYSITATVMRLTPSVIRDATSGFEHSDRIAAELHALAAREGEVYVVYAVTHFNHKPLQEMNVFIGGDCYRTGREIKDLESVLTRTKNLAKAMIRKAVLVFPDIPTLHGGKKGEWIIIDREGKKLDGISDEAIVSLGTLLIPTGIRFLNRYKEKRAKEKGIYESFPARNSIRPDTASPDVLSGPNWKTMCDVWDKRGVDLSLVTCLPKDLGGPLVPSAYPTGYGVVATALKLVEHRLGDVDRRNIRFLVEALGGVGRATIEALKERGISPDQITAFDKSAEACRLAAAEHGVKTIAMPSSSFYESLDPSEKYDVWINNGEGDNTRPEHIAKLLDCGVRVFCGAANNFLKLTDYEEHPDELKRESLHKIFSAGGWAWPDEAASGGGWTLAVVDVLTRAKGERSSTDDAKRQILATIIARNEMLVDAVVGAVAAGGKADGEAVWHHVEKIINERVDATLRANVPVAEILNAADVTRWKLA